MSPWFDRLLQRDKVEDELIEDARAVHEVLSTADAILLRKIAEILFPRPMQHEENGVRFLEDRSIDMNLDAVLTDIEDGYTDERVQKTIRDAVTSLIEVRRLMQVNADVPPDVERIFFTGIGPKERDDIS